MASSSPPPPGGPPPRHGPQGRAGSSAGGSRGTAASGTSTPGRGSGKYGKVTLGDLSGWAKVRHAAKKSAKWGAILGLVGSLIAAIAIFVTYKMIDIPNPNTDFEAQTTTVYYSDGRHVLGQFALQNRQSIPLSQVPMSVRDAVISAEDRSFETNSGLDLKGIIRAAWTNLRSDQVEQGASTITQQYVKILYLTQERTYTRKIREAFLAVKLQNRLSKDEILEGYLNTIYYGRGAYGIQAAAQAFFVKDAKDLSVPESAVLASVINSPSAFDPANGKDARQLLLSRYQYVLDGMVSIGSLDADEAARFSERLPKFPEVKQINRYGGQKGYLMTIVRAQLEAEGFSDTDIEGGGLKVITTFDWKAERAAGHAVKSERPDGLNQLHIALASVEPGTGALRAMIGGRNYIDSQFNWATGVGSPGSAFKPFALEAGLEDGFSLTSTFDGNSPYIAPDGTPIENQGNESFGTVDLTFATQDSINTAYVDLTLSMKDGPEKVIEAAKSAGVPGTSAFEPVPVIALGSSEVSPVDMANSYATFAARGQRADWYVLEKVSDANGLRYQHETKPEQAFSAAIASNVTYALEQVVTPEGTGRNALALERPAAGKTGTATDSEGNVISAWFVGYTPQLSTSVMYVRGKDGRGSLQDYLPSFFGADYPTYTWTEYMKNALDGEPVEEFPEPAELHGEPPTYSPPPPSLEPTTQAPTTQAPTTEAPTTEAPTTEAPTTEAPTTEAPTTQKPTTAEPTTKEPTTEAPTTEPPTQQPTTQRPTTGSPPSSGPPSGQGPAPTADSVPSYPARLSADNGVTRRQRRPSQPAG